MMLMPILTITVIMMTKKRTWELKSWLQASLSPHVLVLRNFLDPHVKISLASQLLNEKNLFHKKKPHFLSVKSFLQFFSY